MSGSEGKASLSVGYFLPYEEVVKVFGYKHRQKSHLEDRFDPKTGAKLEPVKIIDEPGGLWVKLGEHDEPFQEFPPDFDDEEFCEELGAQLGCGVERFSQGEFFGFSVQDGNMTGSGYEPHHYWSVGEALYFDTLITLGPSLKILAKKMEELGLQPSKPCVFAAVKVWE